VKVQLEIDETREIFLMLLDRLLDEVKFSDGDRSALRKWRTAMSPGSDGMRALSDQMNADLARALENQKRSLVRKPDWR